MQTNKKNSSLVVYDKEYFVVNDLTIVMLTYFTVYTISVEKVTLLVCQLLYKTIPHLCFMLNIFDNYNTLCYNAYVM